MILIDLVACHPQVPALAARKNADVQLLSVELKIELARLALMKRAFPCLDQLQGQDLRIRESSSKGPLLRPQKHPQGTDKWTVQGGEQVLFQRFAFCELRSLADPWSGILLLLAEQDVGGTFVRTFLHPSNPIRRDTPYRGSNERVVATYVLLNNVA